MEVDNGEKKGKTTKGHKKTKEEEVSETSETENESDLEPSESEAYSTGSSSGEESESELLIKKKKESSLKRKRSAVGKTPKSAPAQPEKKKRVSKRLKKEEKKSEEQTPGGEGEKQFETPENVVENVEVEATKTGKKANTTSFLGHVDFNLHTEDPNNIVQKTVQISNGLKMTCKMLAGATMSSGRQTYPDWAALIFQKKIKDDKCFEFNVGLKDAPRIVEAINYMIEQNPKFFKN